MRIHVFNLHSNVIESDLHRVFGKFGQVDDVLLVRDKLNNRSLGRAYVEMPVPDHASLAVASLDDTDMKGKKIKVTKVSYDPAPNSSWSVSTDV